MSDLDLALESLTCPYCKKTAKSLSGRTLHKKTCPQLKICIDTASKFKVGQKIMLNGKDLLIEEIKDGLILLEGRIVSTPTRLTNSTRDKGERIHIHTPKTLKEWVETFTKRNPDWKGDEFKANIVAIFRVSGLVQHKKWELSDLMKIIQNL